MKLNNPIPVTNLQSLHREKDRLRLLADQKRTQLEANYQYVRLNYKSLIWKEINPLSGHEQTTGELLGIVRNTILPAITGGTKGSLASIAGVLAIKFARYLRDRKKNKKSEDSA